MNRQQWGWIAALGLSLLFLLGTARYAYMQNAFDVKDSGFVGAMVWAFGVVVALGNLVGLVGAIRDASRAAAIRALNSRAGRVSTSAVSLVLGALFLVAGQRVEPPRTWVCR